MKPDEKLRLNLYEKKLVYQSQFDSKVKGQGYVPVNKKFDKESMKKDKSYIERNYKLDSNVEYKILDTADYVGIFYLKLKTKVVLSY